VNGYETIGITPELAEMLAAQEWSPPVQVRVTRGRNAALDIEFRTVSGTEQATDEDRPRGYKVQPPARLSVPPAAPPVSSGKGAKRATDQ
jgi:hypothetical protein